MPSDLALQLPASAASARAARRAVDDLPLKGNEQALADVRLLVTELVTNSFRHTETDAIRLSVILGPAGIRVEVGDDGAGFTRPIFAAPPSGNGGRGLYLVDVLADRWGVTQPDEPTIVWFEIDL